MREGEENEGGIEEEEEEEQEEEERVVKSGTAAAAAAAGPCWCVCVGILLPLLSIKRGGGGVGGGMDGR